MYECRNYRCRRTVAEPRILPLPDGWTSIVCPYCDAVMQLVYGDPAEAVELVAAETPDLRQTG